MIPECICDVMKTLQWRHNERDGVSNHQPPDCLLNRLFRQQNHQSSVSLAFGRGIQFPAQMASNTESVSIWWRHHQKRNLSFFFICAFTGYQWVCHYQYPVTRWDLVTNKHGPEICAVFGNDLSIGVGVTMPISSVPLFPEFSSIVKTHVRYWITH